MQQKLIGRSRDVCGCNVRRIAASLLVLATAIPTVYAQQTFVEYSLSPDRTARVVIDNPVGQVSATGPTWPFRSPALIGTASFTGSVVAGEAKSFVTASGAGFSAGGWSGWRDTITIDAGPRNGQHGVVSFAIDYSWLLSSSAAAGGRAQANAFVDMNFGIGSPHYQYAFFGESQTNGGAISPDVYYQPPRDGGLSVGNPTFTGTTAVLSFDVVFGTSYAFNGGMNVSVEGTDGSATADAARTLRWAGISRVVDDAGSDVFYDAVSESGFDYSKPFVSSVPEPEQWMLLCSGLGLLALRYRRQLRTVA